MRYAMKNCLGPMLLAAAVVCAVSVVSADEAGAPLLCPRPQVLELSPADKPLDLSGGLRLEVVSRDAPPVANAVGRLAADIERMHGVKPDADGAVAMGIGHDGAFALNSFSATAKRLASPAK